MTLPTEKKYSIIYADPPWWYSQRANHKTTRFKGGARAHYPVMRDRELLGLPVQQIADKNCALLMWVTGPRFDFGIQLLKAWGFRFVNVAFDWVKTNPVNGLPFYGVGYYTKSNPEWVVLGVKGSVNVASNRVSSIIAEGGLPLFETQQVISPLGEHSKKPDIVRDKIVQLFGDLPRIELFARNTAPGWDAWGNEITAPLAQL